jgi:hypothetical protein
VSPRPATAPTPNVASSRRDGLPDAGNDLTGVAARLDILIDQQDEILAALTGRQASPPSDPGMVRVREPQADSAGIKQGRGRRGR